MKKFFKKYKDILSGIYVFVMIGIATIGLIHESSMSAILSSLSKESYLVRVGQSLPALNQSNIKATLSLVPEKSRFVTIDQDFSVAVLVNAQTAINAIKASLHFPKEDLELISISKKGSFVTQWRQEPSLLNELGIIAFAGTVHEGGFQGRGKLLTLVFKPKKSGKISIDFTNASILARDTGMNILKEKRGVTYFVRAKRLPSPDLNADDLINFFDIRILAPQLGKAGSSRYDLNQDGVVNLLDFNILSSIYEK